MACFLSYTLRFGLFLRIFETSPLRAEQFVIATVVMLRNSTTK